MTTSPIRLCYLADSTSTHTVKWISYFARGSRYDVHLMGWAPPMDPALARVTYHHLPDELPQPFVSPVRSALWHTGTWFLAQMQQFRVLLGHIQPDIFDILMINAPGIPAALAWRGPLVVTPWGHDLLVYPKGYSQLTRWLLSRAMRRAALVFCNSTRIADAAQSFGARPDRIRAVAQIVDLQQFRPQSHSDPDGRFPGSPVLLSPRLILRDYAIETLIAAFAQIVQVLPSAVLVQLGDRSLDPAYTSKLDSLIAELGLTGKVVFPGRLDYSAMPETFRQADLVFSVPVSDSRPSSVFEAMASGVPVVASDLIAVREIVEDGETGLTVPVGDSIATAAAALRLLQDKALRVRVAAQALDFVRCNGNYEIEMSRVAGYYDELLREGGRVRDLRPVAS